MPLSGYLCGKWAKKTWQLLLGLMWKNKSWVMPVWIYFSFLMAPADVWGILDFLSASTAQLAPLAEVLAVGDICVVHLHFDLRTLLTLDGDCSHPSHTRSSPRPTVSGLLLLLFLLLPLMPAPWEGFSFSETLNTSLCLLRTFPQISGISGTREWAYLAFSTCMPKNLRTFNLLTVI